MIRQWNPCGGTADFIGTLYHNVLDRDPESQEVIDFHTKVAYNTGLVNTVVGFFNSIEYRIKSIPTEETVKKLYRSILNREPGVAEVDHHTQEITRGRSMEDAVRVFVQSHEYSERVQHGLSLHPRPDLTFDFIITLYQNILDRDPENQAVIYFHSEVAKDRGLRMAVTGFFTSDEYRAKDLSTPETVKKLYRAILGREPDTWEVEHHAQEINRGRSLEDAVRVFVDSPEYHTRTRKELVPLGASTGVFESKRAAGSTAKHSSGRYHFGSRISFGPGLGISLMIPF
ncbi:hypothetical protein DFH08DRAFT_973271 [Mycena albidolilacea]|uniref:DUF4214 domain-containing protein n=1 Tax=Mycena albidolilacea TaxID=1033008 RepID=A0AAD6Z9F0_9AGAR|nr:hypothetical protein DFH08DRAFT_973271 [Mycena albidolilacea]